MIRVFQTFLDKRNVPSSFVDEQKTHTSNTTGTNSVDVGSISNAPSA